jgi:molybdopterin synthase sulfur carrier subunit
VSVASVRLLAFAGARDVVGAPEVVLDLAGATTAAELFDRVVARYPGLLPYRQCLRLAINGTYAALQDPVRAGDEVALIPPVAGG